MSTAFNLPTNPDRFSIHEYRQLIEVVRRLENQLGRLDETLRVFEKRIEKAEEHLKRVKLRPGPARNVG